MPNNQTKMAGHGVVTVIAHMINQKDFSGDWRSSIGTAGTLSATKLEDSINDFKKYSLENQQPNPIVQPAFQEQVSATKRTKVFISYSHQDADCLQRVRVHLKPLEREYALDIWDDSKINAGSQWFEEIKQAISSAKVALLIISADYLASEFIVNDELPPLLDAAKKDGAVILPLIVSPSRFRLTKNLSQFQPVNDPANSLIKINKGEQEEVLVKLSEDIEDILNSNSM